MGISQRIGLWDWLLIALYLAAVLAIGFWARRRGSQNEQSFVRGDQSLPFWAVGISMMATAVAADDFVGEPQFSFASDCALLGAFAVGYIGVIIVATLFLPKFYDSGALTIYGYIGQRFGSKAKVAASAMSCIGNVFSAGVGLFVAAIAITPLLSATSVDYAVMRPWVIGLLVVVGLIGTAYTTIGGIRSVVWTDVLQTVVIFVGGIYAIYFLISQIPLSWSEMLGHWQNAIAETPDAENQTNQAVVMNKLSVFRSEGGISDPYSPITLSLWIVFFVGIFGTNHNYTQRLLACKSPAKAGVGMLLGYSVGMLTAVMFLLIGLLIYLFANPDIMGPQHASSFANSEEVYPRLVIDFFPTGLLGLSLAAMLAAVMSSFDSATAAIASTFTADVWRPIREGLATADTDNPNRRPPLLATVVTGLILTTSGVIAALTYDPKDKLLVDFVLGFASFPLGGMIGIFCCAIFTKRGNSTSAITALFVGPLVWLFVQPTLLDKITNPLIGVSLTLTSFSEHWFDWRIEFAWPWWFSIAAVASFAICCVGKTESPS